MSLSNLTKCTKRNHQTISRSDLFWAVNSDSYGEVQHAVLQHKVVGALDVLALLQEGVVDAGVCEAARQVGARQRLHGHLGHSHGVAQLLHVLGEEVGVAHVEGRHRGVERRHGDGGDLGADCGGGEERGGVTVGMFFTSSYV